MVDLDHLYNLEKFEKWRLCKSKLAISRANDEISKMEDNTPEAFRIIKTFIRNNQYLEAITELKNYPHSDDIIQNTMGYCYLKLGSNNKALECFRNIVQTQASGWKENIPLLIIKKLHCYPINT
jgi:hypothetical protein